MECKEQFFSHFHQWNIIYRRICGVQVTVEFALHRHNAVSLSGRQLHKIVATNDRSGGEMKARGKSARY